MNDRIDTSERAKKLVKNLRDNEQALTGGIERTFLGYSADLIETQSTRIKELEEALGKIAEPSPRSLLPNHITKKTTPEPLLGAYVMFLVATRALAPREQRKLEENAPIE